MNNSLDFIRFADELVFAVTKPSADDAELALEAMQHEFGDVFDQILENDLALERLMALIGQRMEERCDLEDEEIGRLYEMLAALDAEVGDELAEDVERSVVPPRAEPIMRACWEALRSIFKQPSSGLKPSRAEGNLIYLQPEVDHSGSGDLAPLGRSFEEWIGALSERTDPGRWQIARECISNLLEQAIDENDQKTVHLLVNSDDEQEPEAWQVSRNDAMQRLIFTAGLQPPAAEAMFEELVFAAQYLKLIFDGSVIDDPYYENGSLEYLPVRPEPQDAPGFGRRVLEVDDFRNRFGLVNWQRSKTYVDGLSDPDAAVARMALAEQSYYVVRSGTNLCQLSKHCLLNPHVAPPNEGDSSELGLWLSEVFAHYRFYHRGERNRQQEIKRHVAVLQRSCPDIYQSAIAWFFGSYGTEPVAAFSDWIDFAEAEDGSYRLLQPLGRYFLDMLENTESGLPLRDSREILECFSRKYCDLIIAHPNLSDELSAGLNAINVSTIGRINFLFHGLGDEERKQNVVGLQNCFARLGLLRIGHASAAMARSFRFFGDQPDHHRFAATSDIGINADLLSKEIAKIISNSHYPKRTWAELRCNADFLKQDTRFVFFEAIRSQRQFDQNMRGIDHSLHNYCSLIGGESSGGVVAYANRDTKNARWQKLSRKLARISDFQRIAAGDFIFENLEGKFIYIDLTVKNKTIFSLLTIMFQFIADSKIAKNINDREEVFRIYRDVVTGNYFPEVKSFLRARLGGNLLTSKEVRYSEIDAVLFAMALNEYFEMKSGCIKHRVIIRTDSTILLDAVRCYWRRTYPLIRGEWWALSPENRDARPFPLRLSSFALDDDFVGDERQTAVVKKFVLAVSPTIRALAKALEARQIYELERFGGEVELNLVERQIEAHMTVLNEAFMQLTKSKPLSANTKYRVDMANAKLDRVLVDFANASRRRVAAVLRPICDELQVGDRVVQVLLACANGVGPVYIRDKTAKQLFVDGSRVEDLAAVASRLYRTDAPTLDDAFLQERYERLLVWAAICSCREHRNLARAACSSAMYLPLDEVSRSDKEVVKERSEAYALRARLVRRDMHRAINPFAEAMFALYCIEAAIAAHDATPESCDLMTLRYFRERAAIQVELYLIYQGPNRLNLNEHKQLAHNEVSGSYWLKSELLPEDYNFYDQGLGTVEGLERAMDDCETVCQGQHSEGDAYLSAMNYHLKLLIEHKAPSSEIDVRKRDRWLSLRKSRFEELLSFVLQLNEPPYKFEKSTDFPRPCQLALLIGAIDPAIDLDVSGYLKKFGFSRIDDALEEFRNVPKPQRDFIFDATLAWALELMAEHRSDLTERLLAKQQSDAYPGIWQNPPTQLQ